MIFLTRKDEDKSLFELNHRNIISTEEAIDKSTNIKMVDGKKITVLETKEQIKQKAMEYETNIIAEALRIVLRENGGKL